MWGSLPPLRVRMAAAFLLSALCVAPPAQAKPGSLRVRGTVQVEASMRRELVGTGARGTPPSTALRLEGQVQDDTGQALGGVAVSLQLRAQGSGDDVLHDVSTCAGGTRITAGSTVRGDGDGRFCVRVPLPAGVYLLRAEPVLACQGAGCNDDLARDYDALPTELTLDFGKPPVALWLTGDAATERRMDLGVESLVLGAKVAIDLDDVQGHRRMTPVTGLRVEWRDERGQVLGIASSDADGALSFRIPSAGLGAIGHVEHTLFFAGDAQLAPASLRFGVDKTVQLTLDPRETPSTLTLGESRRFGWQLRATADAGVEWSQVVVEASLDGRAVGAAQADARGRVDVPVLVDARRGEGSGSLRFQARANAPFLQASAPVELPVELHLPSSWRHLPLLLALLGLCAWLGLSRWGSRARPPRRAAERHAEARATASLELVEATPQETSWRGRVLDAHDGGAIDDAEIELVRVGFDGEHVLARGVHVGDGFVLDGARRMPGDRLRVRAPQHATHERAAPGFGTLSVRLISRKRAALDAFVAWAEQRPWAANLRREPTPLDAARREPDAAAWAAGVDAAVYARAPFDAAREAELDQLSPLAKKTVDPAHLAADDDHER